jgi:sensor histidine kinase YesM
VVLSAFIKILAFNPHQNGLLLFVLGIIFMISLYHFLLYFQHKSRTYIFYAVYTLLIFISYITFTENDFLATITAPVKPFFKETHLFGVWLYNIAYYFFAFRFLNFTKHHPKQEKFISKILIGLLSLGVVGFFATVLSGNNNFLSKIYITVYVPVIVFQTLYCFYLVYKTPEKTKYYILIGSFVLFLSSVITILIMDFGLFTPDENVAYTIFYVGIVLENVFFSLGVGLRQKEILLERNEAKNKLILKLEENELLKEKINTDLKEKIAVLNQQIHLKEELENLKLVAFKSQMNPHFIFNALNSIKHYIINSDQKNAVHYLNKFSKLIRKILELSYAKEISLEEELAIIELYVNIENIRFSNEIIFQIQVDETIDLKNTHLPPLILQPFLENALWHGLSSKKDNKKITVDIHKTESNTLIISIEDNGIGREAAGKIKAEKVINRKSIGIELTKERLQNFVANTNGNFKLTFKDLVDKNDNALGTKVVLEIAIK